eukprot:TRINITY_DN70639_c0_g1_i1.p1 TRINITY_DN70639_c0_g1~~TRINITY_DN70639_c0_g1_i1.p1  ORF type:complete len:106 (+),score=9.78 TRINITY_DN70639_c0_g1_i1:198-515(+)
MCENMAKKSDGQLLEQYAQEMAREVMELPLGERQRRAMQNYGAGPEEEQQIFQMLQTVAQMTAEEMEVMPGGPPEIVVQRREFMKSVCNLDLFRETFDIYPGPSP